MIKPVSQIRDEALFLPKKSLGQHFLRSKEVLEQILRAAQVEKSDWVLEIGPGDGILTRELARRAGRVLAVEKDARLISILQSNLREFDNVEIVQGDILKLVSSIEYLVSSVKNTKYKIPDTRYKVVANLPYYAAVAIIRRLLESPQPPHLMILMVQKEVGQRICPSTSSGRVARPPKMSLLGNCIQFYAQAEIVTFVDKTSFWPQPKVDSAVIKLTAKDPDPQINYELFFKILKAGFSQPRKQLVNNLSSGLGLDKNEVSAWLKNNGLTPEQRAQTLSLKNWLALAQTFVIE